MLLKSGNFFLVGFFSISLVYGQNALNPDVVRVLLNDPVYNGEIYSYNPFGAPALFWPQDLEQPDNSGDRPDHFIKCGNQLFVLPDGTNRLYTISSESEKPDIWRLDKSVYDGHNFSSFKFCLNDSLYSIGGFGFGHYNGLLLKFEPGSSDWILQNINEDIAVETGSAPGIWLNSKEAKIFKIGYSIELQAGNQEPVSETSGRNLYVLDLKNRRWFAAGFPTSEGVEVIDRSVRIAWHPSGELVVKKDASGKRLYLLDYENNRISPADNRISDFITSSFSDLSGYRDRFLTWYSRDTLKILKTDGKLLKQKLSSDEFSGSVAALWSESEQSKFLEWNILLAGLLVFGSGMFITVLLFIRRKKSKAIPETMMQAESIFTRSELDILRGIQKSGNNELLPDDVNELLGTSKKTIEVQKKQRSDSIKGINEKYRRLSRTEENLILQKRKEDDRRQVRYVLSRAAIEKLKMLVSGV